MVSRKLFFDVCFIRNFCSIIISLLIGPYSDKYGRRPLLLIPLIGHIVAQIIYLVNVYYWVRMLLQYCIVKVFYQSRFFKDASADYVLVTSVYSLFGGGTTFLIGVYSYLADITTPEARTSR